MPVINLNLRYLKWLIGHIDEAEKILAAVQVAFAEPNYKGKVLAFHPVLDAIAEIVDDFPQGFGDEPSEEAVKAEAKARGVDWARLWELAQKILPLILLFIEPAPEE